LTVGKGSSSCVLRKTTTCHHQLPLHFITPDQNHGSWSESFVSMTPTFSSVQFRFGRLAEVLILTGGEYESTSSIVPIGVVVGLNEIIPAVHFTSHYLKHLPSKLIRDNQVQVGRRLVRPPKIKWSVTLIIIVQSLR
jgi:hypothetical protein